MKLLYDRLSNRVSKSATHTYSTSFSLGIHFLKPKLRSAIYAIYGFVRVADEIVDSFEGYDQKDLLMKYKRDTNDALENQISSNPILHAFQQVVHKYGIEMELIDQFLKSMEMDLYKIQYDRQKFEEYIYGSAEVVGLMCLHVFTEGNKDCYEELKPYAMRLGAAFQKVNFLRDIQQDYQSLGRCYFPNVDLKAFSYDAKMQIECEIDDDFQNALIGIKKLSPAARGGVYLAYIYYKSLFKKIKKMPPQQIFSQRVRINNGKKFQLMLSSMVQYKMNLL